jgi:hypothetical protein
VLSRLDNALEQQVRSLYSACEAFQLIKRQVCGKPGHAIVLLSRLHALELQVSSSPNSSDLPATWLMG